MENADKPSAEQQPLIQCQVTGKWVPADEVVEMNGMRVCAEGKQILLQRLKTGEGVPGQLERPTVLRRFGCMFLDGFVIGIPTAALNFGILAAVIGTAAIAGRNTLAASEVRLTGIVTLFTGLIGLSYFALLHGYKGQTVGKMAGRIKVVNLDGSAITKGTALWRAVCYQGPGLLGPLAMLVLGGAWGLTAQFAMNVVVGLWVITSIILALVDSQMQRALHDRIAGTRVIMIP